MRVRWCCRYADVSVSEIEIEVEIEIDAVMSGDAVVTGGAVVTGDAMMTGDAGGAVVSAIAETTDFGMQSGTACDGCPPDRHSASDDRIRSLRHPWLGGIWSETHACDLVHHQRSSTLSYQNPCSPCPCPPHPDQQR